MPSCLTPATGAESGIYRDGLELNHPLLCRTVPVPRRPPHPGEWGTVEVSPIPTSSFLHSKPSTRRRRGPATFTRPGRPSPGVTIKFGSKVRPLRDANLLEDPGLT